MVQATDFLKFGHRLPLLLYLIRKYQNIKHEKFSAAPNEKIVGRLELNQQDEMFTSSPLTPIESEELVFLASSDLQPFLSGVVRNEVYLQNSTSVCCSRVFVKGQAIIHNDPALLKVVTLGAQKGFDETILTRYLNALCNSNGGVLLIGATRSGDVIRVSGVRFKSEQEVTEKQKVILSSLSSLSPACQYRIDKVHVHTNYLEANPKVPGEYRRFCFRILLHPKQKMYVTYLTKQTKGYHKVYQIYRFSFGNSQPQKLSPEDLQCPYSYIHKIYDESMIQKSGKHRKINCYMPVESQSKIFTEYLNQGIISLKDAQKFGQTENQLIDQQYFVDQIKDNPEFKFQNTSLSAVVSKKNERHIKDFVQNLKSKKILVTIALPFPKSFKNCSRSIFILNHQISFQELKSQLADFIKQDFVKANIITLMPVYRSLQVDSERLSQYALQKLHKRFYSRYNSVLKTENAIVQQKNGEMKKITYFMLNDFCQSIYTYMIFQELQVRPYFVRKY